MSEIVSDALSPPPTHATTSEITLSRKATESKFRAVEGEEFLFHFMYTSSLIAFLVFRDSHSEESDTDTFYSKSEPDMESTVSSSAAIIVCRPSRHSRRSGIWLPILVVASGSIAGDPW